MKAVAALCLALACLVAVEAARQGYRQGWRKNQQNNDDDNNQDPLQDQATQDSLKKLFQDDTEYCFRYEAQISTGYAPWVSTQQAMSRLSSRVCIAYTQNGKATLRMVKMRVGQRNRAGERDEEPADYARMQPMKGFSKADKVDDDKITEKLELAVEFDYKQGLVSNIQFHQDDHPWSKNIKKAVLNLIQLNLSPSLQQANGDANNQQSQPANPNDEDEEEQSPSRAYATLEANVEGVCQTSYSLTDSSPSDASINVTKSIDFERCEALADVGYGFQVEPAVSSKKFLDLDQPLSTDQEQQQPRASGSPIPKEKLDRSTTVRYVLSRKAQGKKTGDYGIERVELLAKYVVKSSEAESTQAMQTVAIAELTFDDASAVVPKPSGIDASKSQPESLIYNADVESAEKEFFMRGDQTQVKVFRYINEAEVNAAVERLQRLVEVFGEKNKKKGGIDSRQSADELERLVKVMRMASEEQLKAIEKGIEAKMDKVPVHGILSAEQKKQLAADLFADALAVTATRNTIKLMADKIKQAHTGGRLIRAAKAIQLLTTLGRGAGLPAPSSEQVDIILGLCQSQLMEISSEGLKQACWLTFGTMVGELSLQSHKAKALGTTQTPMKASEICSRDKIDQYRNTLTEKLNSASTIYDKVLVLKCLGNAGLVSSIPSLREVFTSKEEQPIVRINAINALRRLQLKLQPQAIQSQVMSIYADTSDNSEVRQAALALMMHTHPSNAIFDQIAIVMAQERSPEVQALAYSHLKAMAASPVPREQQSAQHLRNAMKLANVDEEQLEQKYALRSSHTRHAFYSQQNQEGVFIDMAQRFPETGDSELPSHMSYGLDTFFNGHFNRDIFKVSLCQNDLDRIAREFFGQPPRRNRDRDDEDESNNQQPGNSQQPPQQEEEEEPGFFQRAIDQLKSIFGKGKIKNRPQPKQLHPAKSSYLMATIRMNNVDVAMMPLLGGQQEKTGYLVGNVKAWADRIFHNIGGSNDKISWKVNAAAVLNSRMSSVPTAVGMGLRMRQSMYVLGQVKVSAEGGSEDKMTIKAHPTLNWVQVQKMEACALTYSSGVRSARAVELNLPLEFSLLNTKEPKGTSRSISKSYRLIFKVPEKPTRVLAAHSHATTFNKGRAEFKPETHQNQSSHDQHYYRIKTVNNEQMRYQQSDVNFQVGHDTFLGVPLRIHGHFQRPRQLNSIKELMKVIMAGDNSLQVEFPGPSYTTRQDIQLDARWDLFQSTQSSLVSAIRQPIQTFYNTAEEKGLTPARKGQQDYDDGDNDDNDDDSVDSLELEKKDFRNSARQQQKNLRQYLEKQGNSQKQGYKHSVKLDLKTVGTGTQKEASLQLDSFCDRRVRICDNRLTVKRSPVGKEENSQWKLVANAQTIYPEYVHDVEELLESNANGQSRRLQLFFANIEAEWGQEGQQQQKIKLNAEGQPSQQMMKQILRRARQTSTQPQDQEDSDNQQDDSDESYSSRRGNGSQRRRPQCANGGRGCWSPKASTKNVPFLDKYTMVATYSLNARTEHFFQRALENVKNAYFWNTNTKLLGSQQQEEQQPEQEDRFRVQRGGARLSQGQVSAIMAIDPVTNEHANITIFAPSQQVTIRQAQLPMKMRPMKLVRPLVSQSHRQPAVQMVSSYVGKKDRAQCKVGPKTIDTFDGVALKSKMSTCYTVLAKDCANGDRPDFAVLMKSLDMGGEQMKLKAINRRKIIEVEPRGDSQLLIKVNDDQYTIENGQVSRQSEEEALSRNGIEIESDQTVILDMGKLSIKFNGRQAKIQLSDDYKNAQCGLCGNFDDQPEDELRKADNELAEDVQSYHRSYTIHDPEECPDQDPEDFYQNKQDFGDHSDKHQQQEEGKTTEQTMIMEYHHKVCFSQAKVKQCPPGWFPADDDEQDTQLLKRQKVPFSCFERNSLEAKQHKREVRRRGTVDVSEYPPSFVEDIVIPKRCVVY